MALSKAEVARQKAEFGGLTRKEARAFYLMIRYVGGERYKSVAANKHRFIAEGLITEAGKLPERTDLDPSERGAVHSARFTPKGHALNKYLCGLSLGDVHAALAVIEQQRRQGTHENARTQDVQQPADEIGVEPRDAFDVVRDG